MGRWNAIKFPGVMGVEVYWSLARDRNDGVGAAPSLVV